MKKCKITVIRKANYPDLSEIYENPIEHACDLEEGQVFYSCNDGFRPVSFYIEVVDGETE